MEIDAIIININKYEDVPEIEGLSNILHKKNVHLLFSHKYTSDYQKIGQELKTNLPGCLVSVYTVGYKITISKLISEDEVEKHQVFFEKCAKDYRELAKKLIIGFIKFNSLDINPKFPLETFMKMKKQRGIYDDWKYFRHGFHLSFENKKTNQIIEVPLVFGLEFEDLDPYFFSEFILSTQQYYPLPIQINNSHADGSVILNKMLKMGKFKRVSSNIENNFGIVVSDKNDAMKIVLENHNKSKWRFNIFKYFKTKK